MHARYYHASLGRWTQADTIVPEPGNPQAFNKYAYCVGNPLRYTDPTGHAHWAGENIATEFGSLYHAPIERGWTIRETKIVVGTGLVLIAGAAGEAAVLGGTAADAAFAGGVKIWSWVTANPVKAIWLKAIGEEAIESVATGTPFDLRNVVLDVYTQVGDDMLPRGRGSGTATVLRHGRSHFSIEVDQETESLHTHQVVTSYDMSTTRIVEATDVSPGKATSSSSPIELDAGTASSRQRELMDAGNLGPYNKITNSCVSHVCDVLQAGGVNAPNPGGSAQLRFLLDLMKRE